MYCYANYEVSRIINLISGLYNELLLQPMTDCSMELYAGHNKTGRASRIDNDQNCEMILHWNPISNIHLQIFWNYRKIIKMYHNLQDDI